MIEVNRFSSNPITLFAFGGEENARKCRDFFASVGISEMSAHAFHKDGLKMKRWPFVRQVLFEGQRSYPPGRVSTRSYIQAVSGFLFIDSRRFDRVRGIKDISVA